MTRYWSVLAGRGGVLFDAFKEGKCVAIGWELGDLKKIGNFQEVKESYRRRYPDSSEGTVGMDSSQIWNFGHEMTNGDKVVVYGAGRILLGQMEDYYYAKPVEEDPLEYYLHRRNTSWLGPEIEIGALDETVQRRIARPPTVKEIPEDLWGEIEKAMIEVSEESKKEEEYQEAYYSVSLEKDLTGFLARNPEIIEKGLRLVEKEKRTDVGRIDLLLEDKKGFVVVETKKGRSSDVVVGQVLRYIGWVKTNLKRDVRGIIVVGEPDENLEYAVKGTDNLKLKYYRVQFQLEDTPPQ